MMIRITFFVVSLILLLTPFFHEISLDEARPWLIASEFGPGSMFQVLLYEAHPPLWYFLLKFLTLFTDSPVMVQLLSSLFGILTCALILFRSPFSLIQKILLALNVYVLYQFSVVARLYSLEVFLIFLAAFLFPERGEKRASYLTTLALLCGTSIFGIGVSGVLFGEFLSGYISEGRKKKNSDLLISGMVVVFGLATWFLLSIANDSFAGVQMKSSGLFAPDRWWGILSHAGAALFIVTPLDGQIWGNSAGLNHDLVRNLYSVLTLILLFLFVYSLKKSPRILAIFLGVLASTFAIIYQIRLSTFNFNYYGQIAVVFLLVAWIAKQRHALITLILVFQGFAGVVHLAEDFRRPYSQGKKTAAHLDQEGVTEIIPANSFFTTSYLVYSDAEFFETSSNSLTKFRMTEANIFPSFVYSPDTVPRPVPSEIFPVDLQNATDSIIQRYCRGSSKIRVVSHAPVRASELARIGLQNEASFTGAIHPSENFYVYRFVNPAMGNPICQGNY